MNSDRPSQVSRTTAAVGVIGAATDVWCVVGLITSGAANVTARPLYACTVHFIHWFETKQCARMGVFLLNGRLQTHFGRMCRHVPGPRVGQFCGELAHPLRFKMQSHERVSLQLDT